jgi:hypothetical protein
MKLTLEEKKALQQSIDHWQNDIINKFVGGNMILGGRIWSKSKDMVLSDSDSCSLCNICKVKSTNFHNQYGCLIIDCNICVYTKFYGSPCDKGGHWSRFSANSTKKYAIAMRDALQAILDSDKENYCKMVFKCTTRIHSECKGYSVSANTIAYPCDYLGDFNNCCNKELHNKID